MSWPAEPAAVPALGDVAAAEADEATVAGADSAAALLDEELAELETPWLPLLITITIAVAAAAAVDRPASRSATAEGPSRAPPARDGRTGAPPVRRGAQ